MDGVKLDRHWISAHIPHQGSMCLLDEVLCWDREQLLCRTSTHRDPGHPLRAHGRLGSASAIEYAAQAVAVHGALLRLHTPSAFGILASARAVELTIDRLDRIAGDLMVRARRLHGDEGSVLYEFALQEELPSPLAGEPLVQGRLSLYLDGAEAAAARAQRTPQSDRSA